MSKTVVKWALIAIGVIALLAMAALAVPVKLWSTGEVPQPELRYSLPPRDAVKPARVWINADAACGTGKRRDPGDCLALLSLASAGLCRRGPDARGVRVHSRLCAGIAPSPS